MRKPNSFFHDFSDIRLSSASFLRPSVDQTLSPSSQNRFLPRATARFRCPHPALFRRRPLLAKHGRRLTERLTAARHEIQDHSQFLVVVSGIQSAKRRSERLEQAVRFHGSVWGQPARSLAGGHAGSSSRRRKPARSKRSITAVIAPVVNPVSRASSPAVCGAVQEKQVHALVVRHVQAEPVSDRLMKHDGGSAQLPPRQRQTLF